MLSRFGSLSHRACRACSRQEVWRDPAGQLAQASEALAQLPQKLCSCSTQQVCLLHGTSAAFANPDNKPAPEGKEKNDPTNVKHDTPTRDPDDTSDYAPGYYDDKGKGGQKRVASQEESKQVPDKVVGGQPEDWHPEEKDDPTQPEPKDPNAADIPNMDVKQTPENTQGDTAADPQDPNQSAPVGDNTSSGQSSMPDQKSRLAGMPAAMSPPEDVTASAAPEDQAGPYNEDSPLGNAEEPEEMPTPASDALKDGSVKAGQPPRAGVENLGQNK